MGFVSPRMSLKIWNAGQDPYDHEQLADNWLKVDQHDHSQGRGTPIGSEGIREGAITSAHIYPGAIGADAIGDGSVGQDKLAAEAVGWQQLDRNVRIPIGTVLDWYWPTPIEWESVLPRGWVVCMGQPLEADQHDFPAPFKGVQFNVPDLVGQVVMGADPGKTRNAVSRTDEYNSGATARSLAPGVGGVGGSNLKRYYTHGHTVVVPGHNHTFTGSIGGSGAHAHGVSGGNTEMGAVTLGSHTHQSDQTLAGDGQRKFVEIIVGHETDPANYGDRMVVKRTLASDTSKYELRAFSATGGIWSGAIGPDGSLTVPNHNHGWSGGVSGDGSHAHSLDGVSVGLAGGPSGNVDKSLTTPALAANEVLNVDTRMAHVGLLKIMKVKNY